MRSIKGALVLLLGSVLFACGNRQTDQRQQASHPAQPKQDTATDHPPADQPEANAHRWQEYTSDAVRVQSFMQIELDQALRNPSIDPYYKEIYQQGKLVAAEDSRMLSITDSLFTTNPKTDLFYFLVFTKSMPGADGFYAEALGQSAFAFVTQQSASFANFFNLSPDLTEEDLNNWAQCLYGEISIANENQEEKAIQELESQLLENGQGARKAYHVVMEALLEKVKATHATR